MKESVERLDTVKINISIALHLTSHHLSRHSLLFCLSNANIMKLAHRIKFCVKASTLNSLCLAANI